MKNLILLRNYKNSKEEFSATLKICQDFYIGKNKQNFRKVEMTLIKKFTLEIIKLINLIKR